MRRYENVAFTVLLMGIIFFALVQINLFFPRVPVDDLSQVDLSRNQLYLLEGGQTGWDGAGRQTLRFTLRWDGGGCLFVPKAGDGTLTVNGVAGDELQDGKQRLLQLSHVPAPDHVYEVVITSRGGPFSWYGACVCLGSLPAVSSCIGSQLISRYLMAGICVCVLVSSLALYGWKRSEKYLFWLALYSILLLLRTQDALGLGFLVGTDSPLFLAVDHFVTSSPLFQLLFHGGAACLHYQVFKHYLSPRLFGKPILVYILAAALIRFLGSFWAPAALPTTFLFFGVLYGCYLICTQKDRDISELERHILSAAWAFSAMLQFFFLLNVQGLVPYGDLGLRYHIPPIQTCIYMIGFFLVACRRFSLKFQEADDLNQHLEAVIREKSKEQTAFIRSMLHNLKTPLFSLSGYADMARESLEAAPADTGRYLDKINEKTQYVSSLIDHVFFLTQMDTNQVVFQRVPVQLDQLLRAVADSALLKGREKSVRVSLSADPDAQCIGDPLYLQQAFQNIADNAVEHMDEGGTLSISARSVDSQWEITFRDDGCGIAPQELTAIFDRYYSNRHGKRASSGLGLTIAKEIVERHGGAIGVESVQGQGAAFTVTLPRRSEEG